MTTDDRPSTSPLARTADLDRLLLWLGLLAAAGLVGAVAPLLGALADALILVGFAVVARSKRPLGDAATALMLVPLLRLLWVTILIEAVPQADRTLLVAVPYLVATFLIARGLDVTPHEVGMGRPARPWVEVAIAAAIGAAGLAIGLLVGSEVHWATTASGFQVRAIGYAIVIAYAEELAFRGLMPKVLDRHVPGLGYALAAVAYAILALGAGSLLLAAITIGLGIATTLAARSTGSLWGVVAGHAAFLILLNV